MMCAVDRRISVRARFRFLARSVLPPVLVFVIVRLVLAGVALASGYHPWNPRIWFRWDSIHYLAIATEGYEFYPCDGTYGYTPDQWCGNTGWFPGYPWLIRFLVILGVEQHVAGASLSALFHLLTLWVLWACFLESELTPRNAIALLSAGFFPGHVYYDAIFPVSMLTFFAGLCLWSVFRKRYVAGAAAGAIAAFSYPTGVLLSPVVGIWILTRPVPDDRVGEKTLATLTTTGAILSGLFAVFAVHYLTVGRWDAFFQVQAKYGHGLNNPLHIFYLATIQPLGQAIAHGNWNRGLHVIPPIQTLLVAAFVIGAAVTAFRRRHATPAGSLLGTFLVVFWIVPFVVGHGLSLYRAESLLLPSVVLMKDFPKTMEGLLLVAFVVEGIGASHLFFRGVLM